MATLTPQEIRLARTYGSLVARGKPTYGEQGKKEFDRLSAIDAQFRREVQKGIAQKIEAKRLGFSNVAEFQSIQKRSQKAVAKTSKNLLEEKARQEGRLRRVSMEQRRKQNLERRIAELQPKQTQPKQTKFRKLQIEQERQLKESQEKRELELKKAMEEKKVVLDVQPATKFKGELEKAPKKSILEKVKEVSKRQSELMSAERSLGIGGVSRAGGKRVVSVIPPEIVKKTREVKELSGRIKQLDESISKRDLRIKELTKRKINQKGEFTGTEEQFSELQQEQNKRNVTVERRNELLREQERKSKVVVGLVGKGRERDVREFNIIKKPISGTTRILSATLGATAGVGVEKIVGKDIILKEEKAEVYQPMLSGTVQRNVLTGEIITGKKVKLKIPERKVTPKQIGLFTEKVVETGANIGKYFIPVAGTALFGAEVIEYGVDVKRTFKEGKKLTKEQKIEGAILGGVLLTRGVIKGAKYFKAEAKTAMAVTKLEKAEPELFVGLEKSEEGVSTLIVKAERKAGKVKSTTITKFDVIQIGDKAFQIQKGKGVKVIEKEMKLFSDYKPIIKKEFTLTGEAQEVATKIIGEEKLFKLLKEVKKPTTGTFSRIKILTKEESPELLKASGIGLQKTEGEITKVLTFPARKIKYKKSGELLDVGKTGEVKKIKDLFETTGKIRTKTSELESAGIIKKIKEVKQLKVKKVKRITSKKIRELEKDLSKVSEDITKLRMKGRKGLDLAKGEEFEKEFKKLSLKKNDLLSKITIEKRIIKEPEIFPGLEPKLLDTSKIKKVKEKDLFKTTGKVIQKQKEQPLNIELLGGTVGLQTEKKLLESTKVISKEKEFFPRVTKQDVVIKETKQIQVQTTSVLMKIKTKEKLKQPVQIQLKGLSSLSKQKMKQEFKQTQKIDILKAQEIKSSQKFASKQALELLSLQQQKARQIAKQITPTIKPKVKIKVPIKPKAKDLIKFMMTKGEFKVKVRKAGEDITIGEAKTISEAKKILSKRLKTTLRASGFVEKGGKKVGVGLLGEGFRRSKVDPFRVVEIKQKRIKQKGVSREAQEIQFFRKQRGNGFF